LHNEAFQFSLEKAASPRPMALHTLWNFGVRRVSAAVFDLVVTVNCGLLRE
jgi:hypothetical protein